MICHGQHTFVYSEVLLNVLSQEPKGGPSIKRLSQEITRHAIQSSVFESSKSIFLKQSGIVLLKTFYFHVAGVTMSQPSLWVLTDQRHTRAPAKLYRRCYPATL